MELKDQQDPKSIDQIEEFIGSLEEYNVVVRASPPGQPSYYLHTYACVVIVDDCSLA